VQLAQFFNLQEGCVMSDFSKDVFTGLIFLIGILGFISGEFIVSSTLFAASAISSNVLTTRRLATGHRSK
jgi:CheY-specific phosphatase CheX